MSAVPTPQTAGRLGTRAPGFRTSDPGLWTLDPGPWTRRGFTLTELLVVIALTAVLMFILFIPLSRSLDLSARGQAKVTGQDNVRAAMRRITRDLTNAVEVFEPRDLTVYGYSAWTIVRNRPVPAAGAQPEPYVVRNGLIAMRLPKQTYFCIGFDHVIQPDDIDPGNTGGIQYDQVALDTCPRPGHAGSPVEMRPLTPIQPDDRIVAYLIALKDATRQVGGIPAYDNLLLFQSGPAVINTYALYRVEFDPRDPRYASWNLPTGQPNPAFFYPASPVDTANVTFGSRTMPRWAWFREASVEVMTSETGDCVRWIEASGKYLPHPTVTFSAGSVDGEVAQPNRSVGQFLLNGTRLSGDLPPLEYVVDHGNWLGDPRDPEALINDSEAIGPNSPIRGPHIEMYGDAGGTFVGAFNSESNSSRLRLVAYDQLTGRVSLAFRRQDLSQAAGAVLRDSYSAPIDLNTYTTDLTQDVQLTSGMPTSYGGCNPLGAGSRFPYSIVVPGSEELQLLDRGGNVVEPLRRAGWTGLGSTLDRFVAQGDLAPDEYTIDYRTGLITLSDRDPGVWASVGPSSNLQLLVRYQFQTNRPSDVVRVSYSTKELVTVNIGVIQYTRRRAESLPFEVSERVVVRNLKR